ncbi:hypothetical protein ACROSR_09575 [Roseovarius tibetensis]|uniref:hypothetical protein n=1 Tax=Roseovarius tibetensis TaxID=2685897 RepID=UPI003D7FA875
MRLIVPLVLAATPAFSDSVPDGTAADCYCTDRNGDRVEMGETICLQVDGKMFMAQCQMSLNNPMWRKVSDGCLSSGLKLPQPAVDAGGVDAHI